jgi:hypothetical protein
MDRRMATTVPRHVLQMDLTMGPCMETCDRRAIDRGWRGSK